MDVRLNAMISVRYNCQSSKNDTGGGIRASTANALLSWIRNETSVGDYKVLKNLGGH